MCSRVDSVDVQVTQREGSSPCPGARSGRGRLVGIEEEEREGPKPFQGESGARGRTPGSAGHSCRESPWPFEPTTWNKKENSPHCGDSVPSDHSLPETTPRRTSRPAERPETVGLSLRHRGRQGLVRPWGNGPSRVCPVLRHGHVSRRPGVRSSRVQNHTPYPHPALAV